MYLTPAQFRAKGYGVSLDAYTDAELASLLARAAEDLHIYTLAPTLPTPHDFRGGTITGETHTWQVDPYAPPQRRVWPYHRPVIEVTQARLYVTKTQYVEFGANEMYYEPSEGWVEPASANLTSYGLFGAAMLPFIGLGNPHISLNYTYGRLIPTAERLYYSEAANTWRSTIGFWSPAAVAVQVNGVTRTTSDYVVDRIEGTIRFTANTPVDGDTVDVTFTGRLHPNIPLAEGLIALGRLSDKALTVAGMGGLRRITVAEITLERDVPRSGQLQTDHVSIPEEAAELLDPFIFRSLAFG